LRVSADDPRQHADLACGRSDGYAPRVHEFERPGAERVGEESPVGASVHLPGPQRGSSFMMHPPSEARQFESFVLVILKHFERPSSDYILHAYLHLL
jgi:hypothetical protein